MATHDLGYCFKILVEFKVLRLKITIFNHKINSSLRSLVIISKYNSILISLKPYHKESTVNEVFSFESQTCVMLSKSKSNIIQQLWRNEGNCNCLCYRSYIFDDSVVSIVLVNLIATILTIIYFVFKKTCFTPVP